jgi:tRNA (adenine57-N1/adenine58-N1)-methyltransferase catalytic subunit
MAKILFKREKKEFIKDLNKQLTLSKQRFYYVSDLNNNFNTEDGIILKKDLQKKDGSIIITSKKIEYIIFSSNFLDDYKKIKRKAQIITTKDIGFIITQTGINNESIVIDAGSGSGALCCYLAKVCKKVISYDLRDDAIEVAKNNQEFLKIKNLKIKKKDICNGFDEKNIDTIILDIPEPWNAIDSIDKSLKIGGFLVIYVPTILQISQFVEILKQNNNFLYIKTSELNERQWKVQGKSLRPNTNALGHTAFLCFARKIQ